MNIYFSNEVVGLVRRIFFFVARKFNYSAVTVSWRKKCVFMKSKSWTNLFGRETYEIKSVLLCRLLHIQLCGQPVDYCMYMNYNLI